MSEKVRDFLVNLVFGAVIAGLVFALNMSREYGVLRCVCDGFFVAAVLLLGLGGIRAITNRGAFDVAGYGLKSAVGMVLPMFRPDEKETVQQYRERKAKERKSAFGLLTAGGVYLILSVAALIVYELFSK